MGYGTTRAVGDGSFRNTIRGGVTINISAKQIARQMRRVRAELPRLRARAFKTQMKTILGQMRKAMANGGGMYGVPKFADYEDFTKRLYAAQGKSTGGPIGGKLAQKGAFRYDALTPFTSNRPSVRIGWIEGLTKAASRFQLGEADSDPFHNSGTRHYWHKLVGSDLPSDYKVNPRHLIDGFEGHVKKNLQAWIEGYVRKTLAHQIAKETRRRLSA